MKYGTALAVLACTMGASLSALAAPPANYCVHGQGVISEPYGTTRATRLFTGDFDGDGRLDYFCKDVREHDSNGNRRLEWLIPVNGMSGAHMPIPAFMWRRDMMATLERIT